MPKDPEYTLTYRSGVTGFAYIHGAEYELPLHGSQDHNVPCAVCYVSTRPTVVMIPAKASCPPTWTREYYGYVMVSYKGHHRTMFECVDEDQESLPGSQSNSHGMTFHHVEATCSTGLPCPPYDQNKNSIVSCAPNN